MRITASAPGKIILLGEYAVLEGAPALVSAINRSARVSIEPNSKDSFQVFAVNLNFPAAGFVINQNLKIDFMAKTGKVARARLHLFKSVLEHLISEWQVHLRPFKMTIDSSEFFSPDGDAKYGLGSSAAVTVALIKALNRYHFNKPITPPDLYRLALRAHHHAQGKKGSGVDISASVFGGLQKFTIPDFEHNHYPDPEFIGYPSSLIMLPVFAGYAVSTTNYIKGFKHFKSDKPMQFQALINDLTQLSESGIRYLSQGNIGKFQSTITEYFGRLDNLGKMAKIEIISPAHKEISEIVTNCGGVYKSSGAGGGDIGIAFCDDADKQKKITDALDQTDYKILNIKPANKYEV